MMTITNENAMESYNFYINELDNSIDLLKEEEIAEIKEQIEKDNNLYMTALDWNVTIIVLKQIMRSWKAPQKIKKIFKKPIDK